MNKTNSSPSIWGGACIIATVCVGAGMLGLPTAGAGGWFFWSILIMSATMIIMTLSGAMLLESLKGFPSKASYSTITKDILGKNVSFINNVSVYFVGFIILYAYITSIGLLLGDIFEVNEKLLSFLSVFFLSFFVWRSTRAVDRASVLLVIFMFLSFIILTYDLFFSINSDILMDYKNKDDNYAIKSLILFPVALTSFGYHHSVSTMRNYYGSEKKAVKAISLGTLIALSFYIVWIFCIFGNIPREGFIPIINNGGNVDFLISSLSNRVGGDIIEKASFSFSLAAIISSFIGVGLGLFDFISDFFKFEDNKSGRTKSWFITFIPPLIFSIIFPFGFVTAIGYAGAIATIWTCIIPAILVIKTRRSSKITEGFRVPGGTFIALTVMVFGFFIAISHYLNMMNILPNLTS
ncbi:aromatic amino acid transporter [Vibrio sp.]|uniref:aromatic amino acid transporter n=1 Tax=Vibrio sp. TaxID=678 RepID=UPI0031204070